MKKRSVLLFFSTKDNLPLGRQRINSKKLLDEVRGTCPRHGISPRFDVDSNLTIVMSSCQMLVVVEREYRHPGLRVCQNAPWDVNREQLGDAALQLAATIRLWERQLSLLPGAYKIGARGEQSTHPVGGVCNS